MNVIREDLCALAVTAIREATEWPQYTIFVHLTDLGVLAIAPRTFVHAHLYSALRSYAQSLQSGYVIRNDVVIDGHIEWETPGAAVVRDMRGQPVPAALHDALLQSFGLLESE